MQETVTSPIEKKSLFSSFMEVLEARELQAQADRQLQEEKYLRRTQRIYDFHDRQCVEAAGVRQCVEYVSRHLRALESAARAREAAPLGGALLRQAAALQRCMAQCVDNAARIRRLLHHSHRHHMDAVLAKMRPQSPEKPFPVLLRAPADGNDKPPTDSDQATEAELSAWTAFVQRAADAARHSEVLSDNLHNVIAEQRRCVREVSSSRALAALCAGGGAGGGAGDAGSPPPAPRPGGCSTPLSRD